MSHSSRDQASRSHQSPEKRQGPAFQSTSPCTSFFLHTKCAGWPFSRVTWARSGGRKRRIAVTIDFSFEVAGFGGGFFWGNAPPKTALATPPGWVDSTNP